MDGRGEGNCHTLAFLDALLGSGHSPARRMSEPLPAEARDMAEPRHLSAELFRRFLDHEVSQSEGRAVVRHLIAQCPECLGLVGRIVAEGGYWFGKEVAEPADRGRAPPEASA